MVEILTRVAAELTEPDLGVLGGDQRSRQQRPLHDRPRSRPFADLVDEFRALYAGRSASDPAQAHPQETALLVRMARKLKRDYPAARPWQTLSIVSSVFRLPDGLISDHEQIAYLAEIRKRRSKRDEARGRRRFVVRDPDWTAVLGVTWPCDLATVRRAYRQKTFDCHPDRPGGSVEKFRRLRRAYEAGVLTSGSEVSLGRVSSR